MNMIPATVLVCTRNEEKNIAACLSSLNRFDQIIVIDSNSNDATCEIARSYNAEIVNFTWNGQYPKKRQWCLDHLSCRHDWVFFVDADEIVTEKLADEIALILAGSPVCAGYFIKGLYVRQGKVLRHGVPNNKIVLFDRTRFYYPVVNDLDFSGMGEMEGHYQPVAGARQKIGQLKEAMLHYAYDSGENWELRHQRYSAWERAMNDHRAWPADPLAMRQFLKSLFRSMPYRDVVAFVHAYFFKAGFFDGFAGYQRACDRARYYRAIKNGPRVNTHKALVRDDASDTPMSGASE